MIDNITPFELFCILILAVILIKPKEYREIYLRLGRLLHNLRSSELWNRAIEMTRDIKDLPNRMDRDAGSDDLNHVFEDPIWTRANTSASKPGDENNHE